METIAARIHAVQQQIEQSAARYNRAPDAIKLLAVSKGQPIEKIEQAHAAGLRDFGENYWQEAQEKCRKLSHLPIRWHFIGTLQSNKAKAIAEQMAWVHSVCQLKTARKLAENRPPTLPPLNICLQINLDEEETKSGLHVNEIEQLIPHIVKLQGIKLRGLMTIPKPCADKEQQYISLLRLTHLLEHLNTRFGLELDTLSMGMSEDMDAAIRAGSTMVRIGRALFGERMKRETP